MAASLIGLMRLLWKKGKPVQGATFGKLGHTCSTSRCLWAENLNRSIILNGFIAKVRWLSRARRVRIWTLYSLLA
jgi:hypothetical protein